MGINDATKGSNKRVKYIILKVELFKRAHSSNVFTGTAGYYRNIV